MTETPALSERIRSWSWWPSAALAGLFAVAIYGVSLPKPSPNPPKIQTPEPAAPKESIQDISAETVAVYTKVLAWFTGVLALVGMSQGYLLGRQIKLARDEFTATHRPRLRVRLIQFDGFAPDHIGPTWVQIANVGDTPAVNIRFDARYCFWLPGIFMDGEQVTADRRLAPWAEEISPNNLRGPQILEVGERAPYEVSAEVREKAHFLRQVGARCKLVGQVIYEDLNGTKRQTGFGWTYDAGAREFAMPDGEDQHNYED